MRTLRVEEIKDVPCKYCTSSFVLVEDLKIHLLKNHSDIPHNGKIKYLNTFSRLRKEQKLTGITQHICCQYCNKLFGDFNVFRNHLDKFHPLDETEKLHYLEQVKKWIKDHKREPLPVEKKGKRKGKVCSPSPHTLNRTDGNTDF